MNYNIGVFSIELFTKTAKFIKRDKFGLEGNISFFAHSAKYPTSDFKNIEIITPGFRWDERAVSFFKRKIGLRFYFASRRMRKFYYKEFKNRQINLVIAHFGPSGIDILDVCRKLNIPLVVIFHGYDISKLLSQNNYIKGLKELSDYKLFHARGVSDLYREVLSKFFNQNQISIIPNGVEVNELVHLNNNSRKITITQACNLVEKKGVEYSIKAFVELINKNPDKHEDVYFFICGDGPLKAHLKNIIPERLKSKIIFKGHLSGNKFEDLKRETDIFIHPSITDTNGETETIPTSILEFMADRKIILSTYHGGIPEVIKNGINGLLHEEKDYLSLYKSLERVVNDIKSFDFMRDNARSTVLNNYEFKKQYSKFNSLIRNFI